MSEVKMKPLGDKVVIRPLTDEESGSTSASGIIIPDTAAKEKGDQGVVVAVGSGVRDEDGKRMEMEVKTGDRVLFKSWSEKIKVEKEEYWVVPESDILAVITS